MEVRLLSRSEAIDGLLAEWGSFEEMVRSLSAEEWRAPTRCASWEVRDVAGHVVGTAADALYGRTGQNTPDDQARERRERSPAEVADELASVVAAGQPILAGLDDQAWDGPSPAPGLTMRQGVETLWYDAYVHGDDILSAIGRETEGGPALRASVAHVVEALAERGWGPATLALDGLPEIAVGEGDGPRVTGDPRRFVLVATGRGDSAELGLDPTVNIYG
jgi:uncharacterized protein (TIGR03083 family)